MWLLRICVVLIGICLLQNCGFRPLYGTTSSQTGSSRALLASVSVAPIKGHTGQVFKNTLEDTINPSHLVVEPKYLLTATLKTTQISLAIQRDRTISRYQIVATADYNLKDITTGKIIRTGRLERESGYDKTVSPYATFVSEETATLNALKALAEDIAVLTTSSIIHDDTNLTEKP